jgi:hypothetical protein|tara:strand:+ start:464 stop:1207 length:744 start_codon:yes stop_codon:yes gene_type:complete
MKKQVVLKDKIYRLTGATAPLSYIINSRNTQRKPLLYFDGSRNRALRYASNQASIFQDEQDDNAILEPIIFEDGMLFVGRTNPLLQEFLHHHPGSGSLFVEIDDEKDATEEVDILDAQLEAQVQAKELTIDMLETIGRIALSLNVDRLSTAELKRDVRLFARNHPLDFLDTLQDPMLKLQSFSSKCLAEGLLVFKNKSKDIYYNLPGNKKKLISIPFGETPVYVLSSFFQTNEGVEVMTMLEGKLEE